MPDTFRPTDPVDLADFVAAARAEGTTLMIAGQGSKRAIGHDVAASRTLDMTGLAGVALYEPEELVLSAGAGTGLAEIEALLAQRGQALAFEPMDYGPLLGQAPGRGTLGGLLATNLAGPRRIARGAARDHMLGLEAVTGRGEVFKAGGRVVKNVTGYDLPRGLAGSWGTLAVFTSVTLKVLPAPEASLSVVVRGLSPERAAQAMAAAMGSSGDVSGAAHVPEGEAGILVPTGGFAPGLPPTLSLPLKGGGDDDRGVGDIGNAMPFKSPPPLRGRDRVGGEQPLHLTTHTGALTLFRLEGTPTSIAARRDRLVDLLRPFGTIDTLDQPLSETAWRAIRDVRPFWPDQAAGTDVWRVSVAPMSGWKVAADVPGARALYDWQGGLVWLAVPNGFDGAIIRAAIARHGGGHATLIRADAATRAAQAVFQPQDGALQALTGRLKDQFDPAGILEPGRMARIS